jgi:hypothetical protein
MLAKAPMIPTPANITNRPVRRPAAVTGIIRLYTRRPGAGEGRFGQSEPARSRSASSM